MLPERMVGPTVPFLVHSPVFRRSDRVIHGNAASCSLETSVRPSRLECLCHPSIVTPLGTDRFIPLLHRVFPEHLFGPVIRPLHRREIDMPF